MRPLEVTKPTTSGTALAAALVAVVASFLATSYFVQRASSAVGDLSDSIVRNAAPSIEHLTSMRRSILESEVRLSLLIQASQASGDVERELDAALRQLQQATAEYFSIRPNPGEEGLRGRVRAGLRDFQGLVALTRESIEAGAPQKASFQFADQVEPSGRRLLEDVTLAIELNAVRGRDLAAQIQRVRDRSLRLWNVLTVLCCILTAVVGWLLHRQLAGQRAVSQAYTAAVESRAEELEQFAGRVAHDIRGPLGTAKMAAQIAQRQPSAEGAAAAFQRILRSISRADAITTALLDFARSGAKPDPGARSEPKLVITDLLAGLSDEAVAAGIELESGPIPPVYVACSTGVYLSLLGNLLRNALKYMGNSKVRRVTVRVTAAGEFVRTEIQDTGPGIPSEALPSLFQPYFRASKRAAEGIGLGLSTVSKLVENHGGRVGVKSEVGVGSTFWFELPAAGRPTIPGDDEARPDGGGELHH